MAAQFRVTRNSDMWVDEDEIDNLMVALKGELHGRNYGASVRLAGGRQLSASHYGISASQTGSERTRGSTKLMDLSICTVLENLSL